MGSEKSVKKDVTVLLSSTKDSITWWSLIWRIREFPQSQETTCLIFNLPGIFSMKAKININKKCKGYFLCMHVEDHAWCKHRLSFISSQLGFLQGNTELHDRSVQASASVAYFLLLHSKYSLHRGFCNTSGQAKLCQIMSCCASALNQDQKWDNCTWTTFQGELLFSKCLPSSPFHCLRCQPRFSLTCVLIWHT